MTAHETVLRSPADVGLVIQQARLAQGLTQVELAARLEISQRAVSEIESGKPTIYARRIFELMRATGVDLRATWAEDDAP